MQCGDLFKATKQGSQPHLSLFLHQRFGTCRDYYIQPRLCHTNIS